MNNDLVDSFSRSISYLRLSVTDRCDFRCLYCMSEDMTFLPRKHILSLEELAQLADAFVQLGVTKVRVTGGEPLIRKNVMSLFRDLGKIPKLTKLCLTTNGSRLSKFAGELRDAGVTSINISLDSLKHDRFKQLTRHGNLADVLKGIKSAQAVGFDSIKINAVLMKNYNLDEAIDLASFALDHGLNISFIEEMPLGEIQSHARNVEYISSQDIRQVLENKFDLTENDHTTGGPSRYWSVRGYDNLVGFISPHSNNFCASCNRVRVTAEGRLLLCLGNEHSVDLRKVLRESSPHSTDMALQEAIRTSMSIKPEKHDFNLASQPQILRFMNATGG